MKKFFCLFLLFSLLVFGGCFGSNSDSKDAPTEEMKSIPRLEVNFPDSLNSTEYDTTSKELLLKRNQEVDFDSIINADPNDISNNSTTVLKSFIAEYKSTEEVLSQGASFIEALIKDLDPGSYQDFNFDEINFDENNDFFDPALATVDFLEYTVSGEISEVFLSITEESEMSSATFRIKWDLTNILFIEINSIESQSDSSFKLKIENSPSTGIISIVRDITTNSDMFIASDEKPLVITIHNELELIPNDSSKDISSMNINFRHEFNLADFTTQTYNSALTVNNQGGENIADYNLLIDLEKVYEILDSPENYGLEEPAIIEHQSRFKEIFDEYGTLTYFGHYDFENDNWIQLYPYLVD